MTFKKTRKRAAPAGEKDGEYISWPRQHLPWIPVASAHLALCTKKKIVLLHSSGRLCLYSVCRRKVMANREPKGPRWTCM